MNNFQQSACNLLSSKTSKVIKYEEVNWRTNTKSLTSKMDSERSSTVMKPGSDSNFHTDATGCWVFADFFALFAFWNDTIDNRLFPDS